MHHACARRAVASTATCELPLQLVLRQLSRTLVFAAVQRGQQRQFIITFIVTLCIAYFWLFLLNWQLSKAIYTALFQGYPFHTYLTKAHLPHTL
jgi:hypothetical protein